MGYQPWYVKQTYPLLQIPLNVESTPDNITGMVPANFTLVLRNTTVAPPVDANGVGVFQIVTYSPAVITYQFDPRDVAAVFSGVLFVEAVFPGGGIAVYDPVAFAITAD
jgi:hypothetical protein